MKNVGTVVLETSRLLLRRFRENDAQELCDGFINQQAFLYYANKKAIKLDDEMSFLKGINERYDDPCYYNWLITLKDDGKIIGSINMNVDNSNESCEFNYAIDERFTGNGYMTEALSAVRDLCLNTIMVKRLSGGCEINNTASRRVMEKCGFTCEGLLKNHLELSDGYHDMFIFSIYNNKH
ncbi:MAG: GNAT family N-acetyltransferase [Erysipelotrichaceae bacterium]|nr:GNAT family N-acetyltransferase [Erysipelotrichaceae bacterium]MBQ1522824.1 GNAT family N-acetyltransferase [Erysipelotrichaceae bacterium]